MVKIKPTHQSESIGPAALKVLRGKKVLITGAAGSIGSALSRRLAELGANTLMLDQDESGLYGLYEELEENPNVDYVIGDIRNAERMVEIFDKFEPDYVFHAAAYKHVAPLERFPDEAWTTNVQGTKNLLHASQISGVGRFVMISTDKAVNPTNVMGRSKREAEVLCRNTGGGVVVRFGNVMASRGSVVPIFLKQIKEGKDLTVTHPDMERYVMGIYDAVELVLAAALTRNDGDTCVLDMESMKIVDLAKWMIWISGKNLKIKFTEPKPGEKFTEELMTEDEKKRATKIDGMYVIPRRS